MIAIKNWELEIKRAKEEIIVQKEFAWQQEWKDQWFEQNKDCKYPPIPPRAPYEVT